MRYSTGEVRCDANTELYVREFMGSIKGRKYYWASRLAPRPSYQAVNSVPELIMDLGFSTGKLLINGAGYLGQPKPKGDLITLSLQQRGD